MRNRKTNSGFTLIEVLVVLAIVSILLTLVSPRYFEVVERSKETTLKNDLVIMRDAIDKYYGDNGVYPDSVEQLVERKYLRAIPLDPITNSFNTWAYTAPTVPGAKGLMYNVHSGSDGIALDGSNYADW